MPRPLEPGSGDPRVDLHCLCSALSPLLPPPPSPLKPGGSTPPGITAPAVPSIPSPIGVNGFTGLPPQANGQPAAEAVFANGIHPYPGKHIWFPFLLHEPCSSSFPVPALTVSMGMCGPCPLLFFGGTPNVIRESQPPALLQGVPDGREDRFVGVCQSDG